MTKITAMPMPMEVSIFFDTPKKGQRPRKRFSTKLLTSMADIMMRKSSVTFTRSHLPFGGCGAGSSP